MLFGAETPDSLLNLSSSVFSRIFLCFFAEILFVLSVHFFLFLAGQAIWMCRARWAEEMSFPRMIPHHPFGPRRRHCLLDGPLSSHGRPKLQPTAQCFATILPKYCIVFSNICGMSIFGLFQYVCIFASNACSNFRK